MARAALEDLLASNDIADYAKKDLVAPFERVGVFPEWNGKIEGDI